MKTKLNHSLVNIGRILSKTGITLICSLALFPAHVSFAQAVASAKMHGIVTDPSGAVVPNSTVIATQVESGTSVSAVTTESGSFTLTNLPGRRIFPKG